MLSAIKPLKAEQALCQTGTNLAVFLEAKQPSQLNERQLTDKSF